MARHTSAHRSYLGVTALLLIALAGTACSSTITTHSNQATPSTTRGPAHGNISILPKQIPGGLREITLGPDGNLWTPATFEFERVSVAGVITSIPLKTLARSPLDLIVGPDHNLWFLSRPHSTAVTEKIGRVTPAGAIAEFAVPSVRIYPSLRMLVSGPDGNLWFLQADFRGQLPAGTIVRMSPHGTLKRFVLPTPGSDTIDIVVGPDGNLWFTEAQSGPQIKDANGDYISPSLGGKIGRISPSGTIREFRVPGAGFVPRLIATASDGNLWFAAARFSDKGSAGAEIGRITPSGAITAFPLPNAQNSNQVISSLIAGPDGNLWFTEYERTNSGPTGQTVGGKIGRITLSGTITEFTIPTANSVPRALIVGPDRNLWFAETNGGKIGRVTSTGTITEFPLPTADTNPAALVAGPDGNIWFVADTTSGQIGMIGLIVP